MFHEQDNVKWGGGSRRFEVVGLAELVARCPANHFLSVDEGTWMRARG